MKAVITGVPRKERWWFWAFFAWIFLALGPGLMLASKPAFVGYFPLLYVWSFGFWIISLVLCYVLSYRMSFTEVPEKLDGDDDGEGR